MAGNTHVLTPRLVMGAALSLLGVLLLLDNAEILNARDFIRYWPVVLIVVGSLVFTQADEGSGRTGGVILIAAGTWLLLNTLDIIDVRLWELFWPLVLILLGVNLIRQTMRRKTPDGLASKDTMNMMAVMGGVQRSSNANPFRSADLFSFMGGCELDLRQAVIAPGAEGTIEAFSIMGGHVIRVPLGWIIDTRVLPVMGGVADNTIPPAAGPVPAPRLVLRGMVIMGGIEIKH